MGGCLFSLLVLFVLYGISWAITCGLIYLICLCFSLTFNVIAATGIWMVLCLIRSMFK